MKILQGPKKIKNYLSFFANLRSQSSQASCEPHSAKMKTFSSEIMFRAMLLAFFCFSIPPVFAENEPGSHLSFTENKGQWENNILFQTDFRGGRLFLEKNNFMYVFYQPEDYEYLHPHNGKVTTSMRLHAVKVEMKQSMNSVSVIGKEPESYPKNFFIGNDPTKWATDVKGFSEVWYSNIYPDINLKVYSKASELKYDYIIEPGGDASLIKLNYSGADKMFVKYGLLYMQLSVGTIVEMRPYAYQQINNQTISVDCEYVLKGNEVSFKLKKYNKNFPLVVDPTLVFSSFTGSFAANWGFTATYDNAGDLYAGGNVQGAGYPATVGAYDVTYGGGNALGNGWASDMAIAKFNPNGTAFLYATYIGGSSNEQPHSLIVDNNNNLLIYGVTWSSNYPVTAGAYDVSFNGLADIVVSKLSTTGNALLASTFIGSAGDDGINIDAGFSTFSSLKYSYADESRGEIIVDGSNNYIIASCTRSNTFPSTAGSYQPAFGGGLQDAVVFKFNTTLTTLMWSTFLGGSADDAAYSVQQNPAGDLYVTGGTNSANFPTTPGALHTTFQGGLADGFISHLSANGSTLLQSTYNGTSTYDQNYFVQLDNSGNVYVCGQTQGNYPVTAGVYSNAGGKQFIHKLNAALSTTAYSTVFGTNSPFPNIALTAFLVDTCENVYASGWARCANLGNPNPTTTFGMPVTANAFQPVTSDGCDFYLIVFKKDATQLLYASHFGGGLSEEHVDGGTSRFDKGGTIYQSVCAGCWGNSDFPTTANVVSNTNNSNFQCNNAVLKLSFDFIHIVSSFSPTPLGGCAPFTTTFSNSSTNAYGYIWDFGDGSPQDTAFQPTHTFVNPGNYNVMLIALNNIACNVSDTTIVIVTVLAPPPINPSIQYIPSGGCDTLQVNFTAQFTNGQIFSWDFGDATSASGINVSHTYTAPGNYIVTLTISDTTCINSDTATITITVNPSPPLNVVIQTNQVSVCDTVNCTFQTNSNPAFVYNWDLGDGNFASSNPVQHSYYLPGSYTIIVTVTDTICNSTGADTTTINVPQPGSISSSINYAPTQYCDSLVAALQAVANFGSVYSWDFGDGNFGNGSNVTHTYTVPGTYTIMLVVIDPVCQRYDTSYQSVTFQPILISGLTTDSIVSGCPPITVNMYGTSNFQGSAYVWTINNNFISNSDSLSYTFNAGGTYNIMLIVSNASSCNLADTATYTVTVFNKPVAAFIYQSKPIYFADDGIQFYDQSIGAVQWNWDFGDGTSSIIQHPVHGYEFAGVYPVCLAVTNLTNCPDEVCHDVPITETIYVPNVFTPNQDNKNEVFRVLYSGIFDMEVKIYDRWGELIHSWKGLDGFWDGTFKGVPVKEDVYVYYIVAKGYWQPEIVKVGRVTVVR
jgi:gliding motility-associated-like protein